MNLRILALLIPLLLTSCDGSAFASFAKDELYRSGQKAIDEGRWSEAASIFAKVAERPQARARREAKASALCQSCDSRLQCRDYARQNREFGFWGNENEEERTRAGYSVPNPIGARRRAAS